MTAAHAAVDSGDRDRALAEIDAALELDQNFVAAQALRNRIAAMGPSRPTPVRMPAAPLKIEPSSRPQTVTDPSRNAPSASAAPSVGFTHLEERARRRRVDRRIDAAHAAIDQRQLTEAAAALNEVIELDPNRPELAELTARLAAIQRARPAPRRGPFMMAAAVFVGLLLGASWLDESTAIRTRQMIAMAPLPAPPMPRTDLFTAQPTANVTDRVDVVDTAATSEPRVSQAAAISLRNSAAAAATRALLQAPTPPVEVAATARAAETSPPTRPIDATPPRPAESVPVSHAADNVTAVRTAEVIPSASSSAPPVPVSPYITPRVEPIPDDALVNQALQQYRRAYERLDAGAAQAVWPAVDGAALARAFDGLESQSLVFEACDVRVGGGAATATCHGSARYVTKLGSREPRVEPRVWNFTLHKAGRDWIIDSARAQR